MASAVTIEVYLDRGGEFAARATTTEARGNYEVPGQVNVAQMSSWPDFDEFWLSLGDSVREALGVGQ